MLAAEEEEHLARMLRNLRASTGSGVILPARWSRPTGSSGSSPASAEGYRDRAGLYLDLECFRAALSDFRNYLMLKPGAEDASVVQRRVVELQRIAARLN